MIDFRAEKWAKDNPRPNGIIKDNRSEYLRNILTTFFMAEVTGQFKIPRDKLEKQFFELCKKMGINKQSIAPPQRKL